MIGLPGNPASALVVFRLIGAGVVRLVGGRSEPCIAATTSAVLARDIPSAPGRARRRSGHPRRRHGRADLCQVLGSLGARTRGRTAPGTRGGKRPLRAEQGHGRAARLGARRWLTRRAPATTSSRTSVSEDALERWRADRAERGCPSRVETELVAIDEAAGRVTAEPVFARRSSPAYDAAAMDGIAVRAHDTDAASESSPVELASDAFQHVDTGDPLPAGFDAVVMREHVHFDAGSAAELRAAVAPYQHVRSLRRGRHRERAAARAGSSHPADRRGCLRGGRTRGAPGTRPAARDDRAHRRRDSWS